MKKSLIALGLAAIVIGLGLVLVVRGKGALLGRDPISRSVSVTFLGYTNVDTRGFNNMYKWAWFRIENKSPFMLSCMQGALDIERGGSWIQSTNSMGRQYDPNIEPGQTLTVSIIPPSEGTKWRSEFLFMRMTIHSSRYWKARTWLEGFVGRLPPSRFGIRSWPPRISNPPLSVVTSETMEL